MIATISLLKGVMPVNTVIDWNINRLEYLDELDGGKVKTIVSSEYAFANEVNNPDLVIGAVLCPGMTLPKLVTRDMFRSMRPGSVIVDLAIDQGECVATAKATIFR